MRHAALLTVIGLAVFANALHVPFVLDELHEIVENRFVRQLWPLSHAAAARWRARSQAVRSSAYRRRSTTRLAGDSGWRRWFGRALSIMASRPRTAATYRSCDDGLVTWCKLIRDNGVGLVPARRATACARALHQFGGTARTTDRLRGARRLRQDDAAKALQEVAAVRRLRSGDDEVEFVGTD